MYDGTLVGQGDGGDVWRGDGRKTRRRKLGECGLERLVRVPSFRVRSDGTDVLSWTQGMDTKWQVMDDGLPRISKNRKREEGVERRSRPRAVERLPLYKTSMTTTMTRLKKMERRHRQV